MQLFPIHGLPEVSSGDDLEKLLLNAAAMQELALQAGDVWVVAQKIVSKAEGRAVLLSQVEAGREATQIARQCDKDPRLVQLILNESSAVVRAVPGVLIVRHKRGFVLANAGIDRSNVPGEDTVLLLPENPDGSAQRLYQQLRRTTGLHTPVLIADSFGRPWREGVIGTCIGCSGLSALHDLRGRQDRQGRELAVTQLAIGDQLCAAASLLLGEADEGICAVLIRGVRAAYLERDRPASSLQRPLAQDLFQ